MSYAKYLLNGEYKDKYQNVEYLYSTVELNKDEFEDSIVVVIGTLFKEGKKKPSILDEYTRDFILLDDDKLSSSQGKQSYITPDDQLFLEDDHGRLLLYIEDQIKKDIFFKSTFSGNIVAVVGKRDVRNPDILITYEIFQSGLPINQSPFPEINEDKYVAFISGIEIDQSIEAQQNIQLIIRYLAGFLGSDAEKENIRRICRLIIAGNLVKEQEAISKGKHKVKGSLRGSELTSRVEPIQTIDNLLSKLGESLEIDIIPGKNDPTNVSIPQQPMNFCLFKECAKLNTVHMVTNPYHFSLDGVEFLGEASQPLDDILNYTEDIAPIDVAALIINSSHLAPTSPDTLNSFPYVDNDPLIIETCPHVFFVGNHTYGYKWIQQENKRVLCLTIPKFSIDKSIVLLNLRTLEPHFIRIGI